MTPQTVATRAGLDGVADKTSLLRAQIEREAQDPALLTLARRLTRHVTRPDPVACADACAAWVAHLPYRREAIETFQGALLTAQVGGDCDDHVILLGALLASLGIPTAITILYDERTGEGRHVFLSSGFPVDSPQVWRHHDTTAAASRAWSAATP